MLSAQATDISVNKATSTLFKKANTPTAMLALGYEGIYAHVKSIGLAPTKTKHILATCQQLIEQHDCCVPSTRQALESLPGVGRKTANVILNTGFGLPTLAVDTHIYRVARRLGWSHATTPLGVEKDLVAHTPPTYLLHLHHWLILLGRYICKARKPICSKCPLITLCPYEKKMHNIRK